EDIVERQTQTIGLALLIEDVDHQQPWLPPRGRKTVASLGRLAATAPATGAHAPTVEADTDPLACQGTIGRDRETESRRQRYIPQMATGLGGGCADTHQTRHVAVQAPTGKHRPRLPVARGPPHLQGNLRPRGWGHTRGQSRGPQHRGAARTAGAPL